MRRQRGDIAFAGNSIVGSVIALLVHKANPEGEIMSEVLDLIF